MMTSTMDQTAKLMNTVWENWENGVQKAYDSSQEFGNLSLETLKKQQEMFTTMVSNLSKVEEEMKNSLDKFTQSLNENKFINNEETERLFGNWNEKMTEIYNKTQQLSATPSKAMLTVVEQSHARMYELAKNSLAEQNKIQAESKAFIENMMAQVKDSQSKWFESVEGQAKRTKKAQSK